MKITKLIINTKTEKYPILIGHNLISKIQKITNDNSVHFKKCLLFIDKNVPKKMVRHIQRSFKNKTIFIKYFNASEKNKNQTYINKILNILLNKNFSRDDCLISIGGGITGDVGGFAASLFKRGLQFINVPTTLLSQVDSSVGGKTGINTKHGKNLIGSFYQPKLVISDCDFLKTLSKREIICGYGEIFKHSLIANNKFFKYIDKNIINIFNIKSPIIEKAIYESCKIKKLVIEKDEKEKNLRKMLNFGHTFAHAYEASLNYSKRLNHGEAVILGINSAIKFSIKNKFLNHRDYKSMINHLHKSELPHDLKKYFVLKDLEKILSFMLKDKKNNSDEINLILLKGIGQPIIDKKYSKKTVKSFLKKELTN
jgi:3-dehydroquinate synthase